MGDEKDLRAFLNEYRGAVVDFYRFRGNYGDSLIHHGTRILLRQLDIKVCSVESHSKTQNPILLIDGGGNLVDYYSEVRDFLLAKHFKYDLVVILPHTIWGKKQIALLGELGHNTTIFCRERESLSFVNEHAKACNIFLWHDCAFYNQFSEAQTPGVGTINAFRTDCESIALNVPVSNQDISLQGYATKPLDELLGALRPYERVRTDRLHVAIASVLLGKIVELFPNSYFKNRSVYEYSLKKYPNISFKE